MQGNTYGRYPNESIQIWLGQAIGILILINDQSISKRSSIVNLHMDTLFAYIDALNVKNIKIIGSNLL